MLSVVGGTDLAEGMPKFGGTPFRSSKVFINPDWSAICHALEGIDPEHLQTAPIASLVAGMEARLRFCCQTLSLPSYAWQEGHTAIAKCLDDASALSDFAAQWGISTDWILLGDARSYVRVRTFGAAGSIRWAAD
jgi:hypothetical protein